MSGELREIIVHKKKKHEKCKFRIFKIDLQGLSLNQISVT